MTAAQITACRRVCTCRVSLAGVDPHEWAIVCNAWRSAFGAPHASERRIELVSLRWGDENPQDFTANPRASNPRVRETLAFSVNPQGLYRTDSPPRARLDGWKKQPAAV